MNFSDLDSNNVPDYIDSMANIFENVFYKTHTENNYSLPPGDGLYPNGIDNGGSAQFNIYVRNLSSKEYGYVQAERYAQNTGDNENSKLITEKNAITSYMAIRNNFENFNSLSEVENVKVTAAHEYFHATQFGYDGWEKTWLLEATAVWMEENIYDEINDCYQYMQSWFRYPHKALDENGFHAYGSFIFFEYIAQNMGGNKSIKKIFDISAKNDSRKKDTSHLAINNALKEVSGFSFKEALNGMVLANQILSSSSKAALYTYTEADKYPVQGPTIYKTINFSTGREEQFESTQLSRYAAQYIKVNTLGPVLISLVDVNNSEGDLKLNAILKKIDQSYQIISNKTINVDPTELESIHLAIVSEDTTAGNWDYRLSIKDGESGTDSNISNEFEITSVYPNPFYDKINFSINILNNKNISISIYNIRGHELAKIFNGRLSIGSYAYTWDRKRKTGEIVSSGTYFIKVSSPSKEEWKPITLIK